MDDDNIDDSILSTAAVSGQGAGRVAVDSAAAKPSYVSCLSKCAHALISNDGRRIDVWQLTVPPNAEYLSEWAAQFRQHYCADVEIDLMRAGTGLSRTEYLVQLAFPDELAAPGPAVRAGDFAELLVADLVEHLLGYWVPRGKYAEKAIRNESVKGVDIVGMLQTSPPSASPSDTLLAVEVKAQLSGGKYTDRLQSAIDDSSKDYIRRAMTLNATKRRLIRAGDAACALIVQRFQNPSDYPYVYRSGAAAVLSDTAYDEGLLQTLTTVGRHKTMLNLDLVVIRGEDLMQLVNTLYTRAGDEA